jgi:hypothetical protein
LTTPPGHAKDKKLWWTGGSLTKTILAHIFKGMGISGGRLVVKDISLATPTVAVACLTLNNERHATVPELHYVGSSYHACARNLAANIAEAVS